MRKREKKTYGPCIFNDRCGAAATSKKHGTCDPCTHGLYYWNRKPAAARAMRQAKLMLYSARIDELGSGRVHIESTRRPIPRKKFQRNRGARA